jgi:selenide,water dikinase
MDLAQVLRCLPKIQDERVLVGIETSDDAGVYLIDDDRVLIQTVDFFTPIVDDPYEYGQIAAANSLSDVYAMGGTPITALNIVGFPMGGELPSEWLERILAGGCAKVVEAGVALLGGHTVQNPEIMYGLSVTGIAPREHVTANRGARPGDDLVLTKALGTGIVTQALKRDEVEPAHLEAAVRSMKTLNASAARAMVAVGAHAATDVTGFGLLGHLYEMLSASEVGAELETSAVPLLPGAIDYAARGITTGGARNNRQYLSDHVRVHGDVSEVLQSVLYDPQTSGGLLIAVAPDRTRELLERLADEGVEVRAVIGCVTAEHSCVASLQG